MIYNFAIKGKVLKIINVLALILIDRLTFLIPFKQNKIIVISNDNIYKLSKY